MHCVGCVRVKMLIDVFGCVWLMCFSQDADRCVRLCVIDVIDNVWSMCSVVCDRCIRLSVIDMFELECWSMYSVVWDRCVGHSRSWRSPGRPGWSNSSRRTAGPLPATATACPSPLLGYEHINVSITFPTFITFALSVAVSGFGTEKCSHDFCPLECLEKRQELDYIPFLSFLLLFLI